MIVAQPTNLLANQMFTYAAVKTIALDKKLDFKYIHQHASYGEKKNSDIDRKYGQDFDTIFSIPEGEQLLELPANMKVIREQLENGKNKVFHSYQKEILELEDNTVVDGILVSPKYFEHRIQEVRQWFHFKSDIVESAEQKLIDLRMKYPEKKIVSVHFRVGKDYRDNGYLLRYKYWENAAVYMQEYYQGNLVFLVFYDKWMGYVKKFTQAFQHEIHHGSLVEDLCMMTKCDAHIISNSTFSIWGALLNEGTELIVRPSVYPIHSNKIQEDSFLDSWEIIEAKRNFLSGILGGIFHYGGIKRRYANFVNRLIKTLK